MHYTKPALSFEQQAQRLIDRGLIVPDKSSLAEELIHECECAPRKVATFFNRQLSGFCRFGGLGRLRRGDGGVSLTPTRKIFANDME